MNHKTIRSKKSAPFLRGQQRNAKRLIALADKPDQPLSFREAADLTLGEETTLRAQMRQAHKAGRKSFVSKSKVFIVLEGDA